MHDLDKSCADKSYQEQIFYKYLDLLKAAHIAEIEELHKENDRLKRDANKCNLSGGEAGWKRPSDNEASDAVSDLCDVVLLERTPFDASPAFEMTVPKDVFPVGHIVPGGSESQDVESSMCRFPSAMIKTATGGSAEIPAEADDVLRTVSQEANQETPKERASSIKTKRVSILSSSRSLETPNACRRLSDWKHYVHSVSFEMIMTSLVGANAVVLAFSTQYHGLQICYDLQYRYCGSAAEDVWPHALKVFDIFDWVFGVIFVLEAALKIGVLGSAYFVGPGKGWNWLDIVCVLAFFVDKMAAMSFAVDGSKLRVLRLVRLVRLLRIIRKLESLDVLYIMATAMKGMSHILIWAMILLFSMLSACALLLSQFLHMQYFDDVHAADLDEAGREVHQELYEYFGTFTRCLMSMFEITLGNWPPVARLLAEHVSEWFMPLALLHKMSIGFAVIGVINGVILQETFKVAALDDLIMVRQKKKVAAAGKLKLVRLFHSLDTSGDGAVDLNEFEMIAEDPEVRTWLASMDIETDDLKTLFMLLDEDKDGTVSVHQLCDRIPRIKGASRSIDTLVMKHKLNEAVEVLNYHSEILANLRDDGDPRSPRLSVLHQNIQAHSEHMPEVHTAYGINAIGNVRE